MGLRVARVVKMACCPMATQMDHVVLWVCEVGGVGTLIALPHDRGTVGNEEGCSSGGVCGGWI